MILIIKNVQFLYKLKKISQKIQDTKISKYASFENIVKNSYYEVNKDELEYKICNLLIIVPKQYPYCQNSLC